MTEPPPTPRPWVAYALIGANVIAFVAASLAGAGALAPTGEELIGLGASYPPSTLGGEPWRLVTSMFLHFGVLHLAMNMIGLYQTRWIEVLYGRLGFVAIYVVAGLVGGVVSAVATPDGAIAGASGAVFGVFGAFGAWLALRRAVIEPAAWQTAVRQMAILIGLNVVIGLSVPAISLAAHAGGLIAGAAVGAALLGGRTPTPRRPRRAAAILAGGVALIAVAVAVLPAPSDVVGALAEADRVEKTAVVVFRDLAHRADAGTISDADFAAAIERDLLAPWASVERRVASLDHPPPRFRAIVAPLAAYIAARRAQWQAVVDYLRAPPSSRAELEAAARARTDDVDRAGQTLAARLSAR